MFNADSLIHPQSGKPMEQCNKGIIKSLDLAKEMLLLSDEGDALREDSGCGVLYGIIRDSAYKIKKLAEAEREAHIKKGWWK
jgi:hypothetical protein